jgi:hypothetical protein
MQYLIWLLATPTVLALVGGAVAYSGGSTGGVWGKGLPALLAGAVIRIAVFTIVGTIEIVVRIS